MPSDWIGLVSGLALVAALAALGWLGLRSGSLFREQSCRVVCPLSGETVDCKIVQDIRTGQWKHVQACSAFEDPRQVVCEQDCARLTNLGRPLLRARRA
jgi:hypothetical protein